MTLHRKIEQVASNIRQRSSATRQDYLRQVDAAINAPAYAEKFSCGNIAHAFACSANADKSRQTGQSAGNIGIVTAYNDMLSAHQPYADYPDKIKTWARAAGGTAQVAGGVPAMCDGVTQGQPGMELSLFSRDVIALSSAIALSHNVFDAAVFLGICDKIVPGMVMAAGAFGHLPCLFLPSGPMASGISNEKKGKVRQEFAAGKIGKDLLLETEMQSYHSAGTCTFYGTANSNQMLLEFLGLQLPGSSFVHPDSALRQAFNEAAIKRSFEIMKSGHDFTPAAHILDVPNFVNAIIGLLASGGSTNELLHLVAMARSAGIILDPQDFSHLSEVIPLMCKVYPNGKADVNDFHAAGGLQFLIANLLENSLLFDDVKTVLGGGMSAFANSVSVSDDGSLSWGTAVSKSANPEILRTSNEPFQAVSGLKLLEGNLGRSIIKTSALKPEHMIIEAKARVFSTQHEVKEAFERGELHTDMVCVVRFQGPRSNGMPELHSLTPLMGLLQDEGFHVALVTDGRMSGASGRIPAAIHLAPEANAGGPIARIQDGDLIRLDAIKGELEVLAEGFDQRKPAHSDLSHYHHGNGRELFKRMRALVSSSTDGASFLF